jgi:hypothetical protein
MAVLKGNSQPWRFSSQLSKTQDVFPLEGQEIMKTLVILQNGCVK